jgi:hypothetical protein
MRGLMFALVLLTGSAATGGVAAYVTAKAAEAGGCENCQSRPPLQRKAVFQSCSRSPAIPPCPGAST